MMEKPLEAVLTGDVVQSSRLTDGQFKSLATLVSDLGKTSEGLEFNGFDRGNDGFQCLVRNPVDALRLALRMRAAAMGVGGTEEGGPVTDLRVSVGIGPLVNERPEVGRPLGEAWILSGRGLETLKRGDRRLWVEGTDAKANLALEAVSRHLDFLFSRLTFKQAEVLALLLEGMTQTEVAQRLSKSQSTVSSHVQAMGWREVEAALRLYGEAVLKTDG